MCVILRIILRDLWRDTFALSGHALPALECECPSLSMAALWRAQPFTEVRLALNHKVPLVVHDFRSCIGGLSGRNW